MCEGTFYINDGQTAISQLNSTINLNQPKMDGAGDCFVANEKYKNSVLKLELQLSIIDSFW